MPDVQCGLIGCGTVGGGVVARWAEEAAGAVLAAVAVRSQFVSAGRLGWVQAITSRVPRERVRRALARLDAGEIAHVTFHESARGAVSLDQPALAAAGGSR